jgi:outer membrane biosynthesis protein TonB
MAKGPPAGKASEIDDIFSNNKKPNKTEPVAGPSTSSEARQQQPENKKKKKKKDKAKKSAEKPAEDRTTAEPPKQPEVVLDPSQTTSAPVHQKVTKKRKAGQGEGVGVGGDDDEEIDFADSRGTSRTFGYTVYY